MKRALLGILLAAALIGATAAPMIVTTQILDYEKGYVFFTTGDGFHVAPNVQILNGTPGARRYARVTFDGSGTVIKIELSNTKLPPEGDLSAVRRFAIALSTPAPNPDLAPRTGFDKCRNTIGGRLVTVAIEVQVPPSTALTDQVYMTTDQSGWYSQAYRLDRIDTLHYRTVLKLYSGTQLHVLFDRGSTQSIQVGENGIESKPGLLCVGNEDVQAFRSIVYHWADEQAGGTQQLPQTMPTPYNPAPFPNLPPAPRPTPLP
jgi:hypothetical protein